MSTEPPPTSGFEPPKYVASLIAAVNDGAKAAQGGLLLYMLVGLYLLASAFSSTDEDLLRGNAVTIAQIGASLPVSFTFAIAPLVFVFLHVYTLTRFDMLAANVRHFVQVLPTLVPCSDDQEHCLHLLSNVEFIVALAAEPKSALYSRFWRWMVRGLLAGFPVTILLLVQINALRYQSQMVRLFQAVWLFLDLVALCLFFCRNTPVTTASRPPRRAGMWRVALAALVFVFNCIYLNVVPEGADTKIVRGKWANWSDIVWQPLDTLVCPNFGWGCRYLRVERRTVVAHVWDDKVMVALHDDAPDFAKLLPAIDGVDLRGRSLRFAVLDGSRLFNADLTDVRLTGADLSEVQMAGANLSEAQLEGANLSAAKLAGANLSSARLARANLYGAQLGSANLSGAQLAGANLEVAALAGANLVEAQLAGANLTRSTLESANMTHATLAGADLSRARLAGADLGGSQSAGANLSQARLSGAELSGAQLPGANLWGADLAGANLWGTELAGANLMGAELEGANLMGAKLEGANVSRATLAGADLSGVQLSGANLSDANLVGADLSGAQLMGANLSRARLLGANLSFAQLTGADLRNAHAPLIVSDDRTALTSADVRGIDFSLPRKPDLDAIRAILQLIPEGNNRIDAQSRLSSVLSGKDFPEWRIRFVAEGENKLLVSPLDVPDFGAHPAWLTTAPDDAWRFALSKRLAAELADKGLTAADGVASRAVSLMTGSDDDRLTGQAIACRLLADSDAQPPRLNLSQAARAQLTDALSKAKLTCEPSASQR